jgi:Protein of unknown function (DUF3761)
MKTTARLFLACILTSAICIAQAPAGAPAGATGLCNDGTYYTEATKRGACRGHKGVKEWYGSTSATSSQTDKSSDSSSSSAAAPASTPASSSAPTSKSSAATSAPAPGGGADKVWLNTASNVYHCPGTRYYGKTKAGAYMTEAEAKAKGARPDHGKACK